MKTYILSNMNEIEKIIVKTNQFADNIGSSLPFHRLQFPLIWWKHFHSDDHSDFTSKRRRNFFGIKSWLREVCFIVVEDGGKIIGVAPLFFSDAILRGTDHPVKILSLIPDSAIMFYQDFLINHEYREKAISIFFQCIEKIIDSGDILFFIGHIPSDSPNLQYYSKEINSRLTKGWSGGETVTCRRGGAYIWNTPILCRVLRAGLYKLASDDEEARTRVKTIISSLESKGSTLLFFKDTREKLEKQILDIVNFYEERNLPKYISSAILDVFDTKPVVYPYRDLPGNIDEFYSSLSSSKRYFYRRYMRKFLAEGGTFEKLDPMNISLSDIQDFYLLHIDRWGSTSGSVVKQTMKFHHESLLSMAEAGYCRLFFARFKGKRIAGLVSFDVVNRREFYKSGRSLNYSNLRAGKLLVLFSILDAIENGFEVFDFGYGYEEYKFDFTKNYRTVTNFFLSKNKKLPDLEKLFPVYEKIVL